MLLLTPLQRKQPKTYLPTYLPNLPNLLFELMGISSARVIRADLVSSLAPYGYVAAEDHARLIRAVPSVSTSSCAMDDTYGDA